MISMQMHINGKKHHVTWRNLLFLSLNNILVHKDFGIPASPPADYKEPNLSFQTLDLLLRQSWRSIDSYQQQHHHHRQLQELDCELDPKRDAKMDPKQDPNWTPNWTISVSWTACVR